MIKLILIATILSSPALGGCTNETYFRYFPNSLLEQGTYLQLLAALGSNNSANLGTAEKIIDSFKDLARRDTGGAPYWEAQAGLMRPLAADSPFGFSLIKLYVNIKKMQEGADEILKHLEQLAKAKFESVFRNPGQYVRERTMRLSDHVERRFDSFLMTAYNLKKASDVQLFQLARGFNFSDKNLHIGKLVKLAYEVGPNDVRPRDRVLIKYFYALCFSITPPTELLFDIYNVANSMDPAKVANVPIRFKKMNEYMRTCNDLQHPTIGAKAQRVISQRVDKSQNFRKKQEAFSGAR